MSQKSSLPQAAKSVSQGLMSDTCTLCKQLLFELSHQVDWQLNLHLRAIDRS